MVDSLFIPMAVRRLVPPFLLVLLFGFSTAAVQRPRAPSRPSQYPNVILITLDTTRADRMGFLGSKRGLTPNLDAMAQQGVVFTRAYSHVPLTTASHTTIFTGTYPQFNHVNDFGVPLSPKLPYLPELLHQRGYQTGAFVGSLVLDPLDGTAPGFDRGFDVYDAGFHLRRHGADRYTTIERRGGTVVDHALAWLSHVANQPIFLWIHLYDAHDPYDPPSPYKERFPSQAYDGEIAYADACVGKLLDALRRHGLYEETLIAVMADHGESLGAHGESTHGVFLYEETLHVPLLIKLPLNRAAGRRIETRARLVDIAPTILRAAGLVPPAEMQGQSLLELTQAPVEAKPGGAKAVRPASEAQPDRPVYAETDYPHRAFGWSALRAWRTGKYLYIQAPEQELYDQSIDAGATRNLAESSKAVAGTLASQLADFREKTSQTLTSLAKPDPEQMQKLQALGYVSAATNSAQDQKMLGGTDPKVRIEIANLLHDAMFDVEDARYEQAVPLLERALAVQPEMPVANMQYGIAQARLKHFDLAITPLRKAVTLQPDNGMGHYELGLALFETGDWKAAAPEFESAAARAPHWADAHFSLAAVYARIDRVPDAMAELDSTLGISPDHYRANLLRGRILFLQGNPLGALNNLEKATQVEPDSREAHLFLADAYTQLGRVADAQKERAAAQAAGLPAVR
jgi:arylsulfatase A-like enzyme/Tfp pilus assembly protein PilF